MFGHFEDTLYNGTRVYGHLTIKVTLAHSQMIPHNTSTVEPLTNDHPHQRPSLSYDHISCDGQWFLFVYESLTSDHPSYTTTPMWFWGWSYKRGSTVVTNNRMIFSFGNTVTSVLRSLFPSPLGDRNSEVPLCITRLLVSCSIPQQYVTSVQLLCSVYVHIIHCIYIHSHWNLDNKHCNNSALSNYFQDSWFSFHL